MNNQMIIIIDTKKKMATTIPLSSIQVKAEKDPTFKYIYNISNAIDIFGNSINLEKRSYKLRRYIIAYRMGDGKLGIILDEYIGQYSEKYSYEKYRKR